MATAPRSFAAAAASNPAGSAAQNGPGGAAPGASSAANRDRQRIIAASAELIGSSARVQTTEGVIYQGTVRAYSMQGGIVLSKAHRSAGGLTDEKHALEGNLLPELVLRKEQIAQIYQIKSSPAAAAAAVAGSAASTPPAAAAAAASTSAPAPASAHAPARLATGVEVLTDSAIRASGAPSAHTMQRWVPEGKFEATAMDLGTAGTWNSREMLRKHDETLKANGKQSNYSEEHYTSSLNQNATDFQARRQHADKLAKEMEQKGTREDSKLESSAENEEAKYSQVISDKNSPKKDTSRPLTAEFKSFSEQLHIKSTAGGKGGAGAASSPTPSSTAAAAASPPVAVSPSPAASEAKSATKLNPNAKEFVPTGVSVALIPTQPTVQPFLPAQHHPQHHPHPHTLTHTLPPQPMYGPPPQPHGGHVAYGQMPQHFMSFPPAYSPYPTYQSGPVPPFYPPYGAPPQMRPSRPPHSHHDHK